MDQPQGRGADSSGPGRQTAARCASGKPISSSTPSVSRLSTSNMRCSRGGMPLPSQMATLTRPRLTQMKAVAAASTGQQAGGLADVDAAAWVGPQQVVGDLCGEGRERVGRGVEHLGKGRATAADVFDGIDQADARHQLERTEHDRGGHEHGQRDVVGLLGRGADREAMGDGRGDGDQQQQLE